MSDPVLVVDVQLGFLNEFTHHIPGRIARLIERDRPEFVLFTRFINAPGGPWHQFLDWHACADAPETDLAPELDALASSEAVFSKPGLAGIPDELGTHLRERGVSRMAVAGIDTDMCVLKVALDLFDLGIEPLIYADCCASTAGLQAHLAGLAVLARNIGASRLLETGLSAGHLAAPPIP